MSLVGKPRPGVCGYCGCAVVRSVRPPPEASDARQGNDQVNGHLYEAGKLVRVRCKAHGGLVFEGEPPDCFGMPSASGTVYGTE